MTPDMPWWVWVGLVVALVSRLAGKLAERLSAERAEAAWWAQHDTWSRAQPGPEYPEPDFDGDTNP